MKRIWIWIVAGGLLFSACAAPQTPEASLGGASSQTASGEDGASASESPLTSPTALPGADLTRDEYFLQMSPILDSLTRAMLEGEGSAYQPENPDFVWKVLYLMGSNWGYTYPDVDTGEQITAPPSALRHWMRAAFSSLEELPEIPAGFSAARYDASSGVYLLDTTVLKDTVCRLEEAVTLPEGGQAARMGLYLADGARLGGVTFTLSGFPGADSVCDPIYYYTVTGAVCDSAA